MNANEIQTIQNLVSEAANCAGRDYDHSFSLEGDKLTFFPDDQDFDTLDEVQIHEATISYDEKENLVTITGLYEKPFKMSPVPAALVAVFYAS